MCSDTAGCVLCSSAAFAKLPQEQRVKRLRVRNQAWLSSFIIPCNVNIGNV